MKALPSSIRAVPVIVLSLLPVVAQAHPGHGVTGFNAGLEHPISGLDHILAMVAVGLWAVQLGGRAIWMVPLSFVGAMIAGGALGMAHVPLPFVEHGILASVLILGLLIALAARLPLGASMAVVGVFALFHGHAHGADMPGTSAVLGYGFGFALATTLLHGAGMSVGFLARKAAQTQWVRLAGVAIALAGMFLIFT
jgi:urease accessory protein